MNNEKDKSKLDVLKNLRIGQEVIRLSFDMGVQDTQCVICGLSVNPFTGKEDITLAEYDGDGCFHSDGYTLDDIRV